MTIPYGIKVQIVSFTTEGTLTPIPTGQYPEFGFSNRIELHHNNGSKLVSAHVNTGTNVDIAIQGSLDGTFWTTIYSSGIAPSGSYACQLPLCKYYRMYVDAQQDSGIRTSTLRIGN